MAADGFGCDVTADALDRADGTLYRQLAARLRAAIRSGRLAVGSELDTESDMAQAFGVSLITVRHALRELQTEGLIRKRIAKAAIVVATAASPPTVRSLNSLEDIVAATSNARLRISSYRSARSAHAAAVFGLDPSTPLPCLRGRVLLRGAALSEITIFFPPAIGSLLARTDFDDVVVFRSVQRRLGIHLAGARVTMRAEVADAGLARRLDCAQGSAVLVSEIVYVDAEGRPTEMTIARHRGDRYSPSYEINGRSPSPAFSRDG
jgi:GntR family transcriptional regulator